MNEHIGQIFASTVSIPTSTSTFSFPSPLDPSSPLDLKLLELSTMPEREKTGSKIRRTLRKLTSRRDLSKELGEPVGQPGVSRQTTLPMKGSEHFKQERRATEAETPTLRNGFSPFSSARGIQIRMESEPLPISHTPLIHPADEAKDAHTREVPATLPSESMTGPTIEAASPSVTNEEPSQAEKGTPRPIAQPQARPESAMHSEEANVIDRNDAPEAADLLLDIMPTSTHSDMTSTSPQPKASPASPTDVPPSGNSQSPATEKKDDRAEKDKKDTVDDLAMTMEKLKSYKETLSAEDMSVEAVESGIRGLADGIPSLMRALDNIMKVHPFVAVAVLAFRAAYALELKRRDNDKKIMTLFIEMKDMMSVLIQLRPLTEEDAKQCSEDGSSIATRLGEVCERTASEIRSCSNTCDAYNKKSLMVRCLKSPLWEPRLAEFVKNFSKLRDRLMTAMTTRMTVAVDEIGKDVKSIEAIAKATNDRVDLLLSVFQKLTTPQERELQDVISDHGGATEVQKSEKALLQLIEAVPHLEESATDDSHQKSKTDDVTNALNGPAKSSGTASYVKTEKLRRELAEDIDTTLAKNMDDFSRKFQMQLREVKIELGRQGDRIIEAIEAGPHKRVVEGDVQIIWKEMGWKLSVKAQRFVLALHDHFSERSRMMRQQESDKSINQDTWALRYLELPYLDAIHEAIDDDATGFISIEEINDFTSSRPSDWSLIKWIAYWAIGFNIAMVQRRLAINKMFDQMFSLVPRLRKENQWLARKYLNTIWYNTVTVTYSIVAQPYDKDLETSFKDYIQSEEDRIRKNLKEVKFKIDQLDTLALVTGPGRIEMHFCALVKVLLERHLDLFHIARTKILDEREFSDSWECFVKLKEAVDMRLKDLKVTSPNRALGDRLENFCHGIFRYSNKPSLIWAHKKLIGYGFDRSVYDASIPYDDSKSKEILAYEERVTKSFYTSEKEHVMSARDIVTRTGKENNLSEVQATMADILTGKWRMLFYDGCSPVHPCGYMLEVEFRTSEVQEDDGILAITATDLFYWGERWTLTGSCRQAEADGKKLLLNWVIKYAENYMSDQHFSGTFDPENHTITGTAGSSSEVDAQMDTLYLSQQPAEVLVNRPHPAVLAKNRYAALWRFAWDAVMLQTRMRLWSWSYFRKRRDVRRRYLELEIRSDGYFKRPLSDAEDDELYALCRTLYPADAKYLGSLSDSIGERRTHDSFECDSCKGRLIRERMICMECISSEPDYDTFELCGDKRCQVSEISRQDLASPHLPTHRLINSRRTVLHRDFGYLWRTANSAIEKGDKALTDALQTYKDEESTSITKDTAEKAMKPPALNEISSKVQELTTQGKAAIAGIEGTSSQALTKDIDSSAAQTSEIAADNVTEDTRAQADNERTNAGDEAGGDTASSAAPTPKELVVLSTAEDAEAAGKSLTPDVTVKSKKSITLPQPNPPPPNKCYFCDGRLESPCWYCIECEKTTLICRFCDPHGGFNKGNHMEDHTLLLVRKASVKEKAKDMAALISSLETKIEGKLTGMDSRIGSLDDKLSGRMVSNNQQVDEKNDAMEGELVEKTRATDEVFHKRLDTMEEKLERMDARQSRMEDILEKVFVMLTNGSKQNDNA